jgi:tRNA 5-methylaminomethyl-2-thiouridine biosynthesis bifunctional protein
MPSPIVPATAAFDANGTPFSPEYGDVYHSAQSGPGQARHVFLGGNGLPARWAGARAFTIVETGFGLGVNFLATWEAWRGDPARPGRLHFVSIEKHPLSREALSEMHRRYPEQAALAAELHATWPLPLPGLHRLHFERERVILTLVLADAAQALPRLRLAADAFFLDGFAPARNPDMWSPAVIKGLARLARPGATLATYTAARAVRDALSAAGFKTEQRTGFGAKRHMLAARYEPRTAPRSAAEVPQWSERRAIVVGGGLAGAWVTERLAARGWHVDLVERRSGPALESSAIPAGVFHPHVSRDDSLLSRLTRAGCLYALGRWRALEADGARLAWARCGVLQLAKDAREEARMAATARALGFPSEYVDFLARAAASRHAGQPVRAGGWWFPESGWMRPATLIAAQLAAARGQSTIHTGREVRALARGEDGLWRARDADGALIAAAPLAVLANSHDAARLAAPGTPLKRVRGQLTALPEGSLALRTVLTGAGHVIPGANGSATLGSTYDFDDPQPEPSAEGHAANLARLEQLLPASRLQCATGALEGCVGFRCVAGDRLPLIGALANPGALPRPARNMQEVARTGGLYGAYAYASRGLTWATLGGEIIACLVEGEPLPVESDLADAVDPARFALRRARRGTR